MGSADPRIDRYLAKDRPWRDLLVALREILLSEDLEEALKWRQPCYAAHGGNIAILGALSDGVTLGFFKGVLLDDPDGLLSSPGPNSRSVRRFKFSGIEDIRAAEGAIRGFVREAIRIEGVGQKVDLPKGEFIFPTELLEAFDGDTSLAGAFKALTPGRQRAYVLNIEAAKQPATRRARIAKWAPRILAGKGPHDRD